MREIRIPSSRPIEVQPKRSTRPCQSEQQLKVLAHYSDGSSRDVTRTALYEPNDKSMAEADEAGLVKLLDIPGNVAVMVRYQGLVSVYSASIPLGAQVGNLPAAKNFIDQLVFANLTELGIPPSPLCDDANVSAPRLARHRGPFADRRRDASVSCRQRPEQARPPDRVAA